MPLSYAVIVGLILSLVVHTFMSSVDLGIRTLVVAVLPPLITTHFNFLKEIHSLWGIPFLLLRNCHRIIDLHGTIWFCDPVVMNVLNGMDVLDKRDGSYVYISLITSAFLSQQFILSRSHITPSIHHSSSSKPFM